MQTTSKSKQLEPPKILERFQTFQSKREFSLPISLASGKISPNFFEFFFPVWLVQGYASMSVTETVSYFL